MIPLELFQMGAIVALVNGACPLHRMGLGLVAGHAGVIVEDADPFWQRVHDNQGCKHHKVYAVRLDNGARIHSCETMLQRRSQSTQES